MQPTVRARLLFFAVLAGLMFAELLFRNAGALVTDLNGSAAAIGLTPESQQVRLFLLIVLDGIAGGGAVLAALAHWQKQFEDLGEIGVYMATGGLVAYGTYQFMVGAFQVDESGRIILFIGIFYFMLGLAAARAGSELLETGRIRRRAPPLTSQPSTRHSAPPTTSISHPTTGTNLYEHQPTRRRLDEQIEAGGWIRYMLAPADIQLFRPVNQL